jgi:hypothetical protein
MARRLPSGHGFGVGVHKGKFWNVQEDQNRFAYIKQFLTQNYVPVMFLNVDVRARLTATAGGAG